MQVNNDMEDKVTSWLKVVLAEENIKNLSVQITKGCESVNGLIGDIIFVVATGTDKKEFTKEYNLALKCSKESAALMEKIPAAKEVFIRENYIYEKIFPIFRQFQLEAGITKPFDSVPKFYGVYNDGAKHVLVMENLKQKGYELWDNKRPLTRKHIDAVIKEYARYHAISVAFSEQYPKKFEKLTKEIVGNMFAKYQETNDFVGLYKNVLKDVYDMIKDDVSENIAKKWLNLKDQVHYICIEMEPGDEDLKVVMHGDSWSNNFLFKYSDEKKTDISDIVILDWQLSALSTPIKDLSYFSFACISGENLANMNTILKEYYNTFIDYLEKLGSGLAKHYSFENFLVEWKKFGKYGVVWCLVPLKFSYTDSLPDLAKIIERGEDINDSLLFRPTYEVDYKKHMLSIVRYAVEADLI